MSLSQEKKDDLKKKMQILGIKEDDIEEKFILGSGSGGQKINKTSSCVYLKHLPSGIEVKCQQERSRELNRFFARRKLVEQFEKIILEKKTEAEQKREKIRRQKQRKTRKQKQKMMETKAHVSEKKKLRAVRRDEE